MPKFFFLVTLSCFSYFSHAGNQFSEWRVVSPSGVSGIFGSAGAACSAGISKKESDVNESHPGEYEFQRTSDEGSYFEGGAEVYCGHEYKAVEGFPSGWSTFWPYSGATVVGGSEGCKDGKIWSPEKLGCFEDPANSGGGCNLTKDPINIATGAKFFSFEDFGQAGNSPISFARSYNDGEWSFSYSQKIEGYAQLNQGSVNGADDYYQVGASYYLPDGKVYEFSEEGNEFSQAHNLYSKQTSSILMKGLGLLHENGSAFDFQARHQGDVYSQKGYEVSHKNGRLETYDSEGFLTAISLPNQLTTYVSRVGNMTVLQSGEARLQIEKNSNGEPVRLILPSGEEILYLWEAPNESSLGRLKSVVYPDAEGQGVYTVDYFYDNEKYVSYVTRIEDSDGRILSKVTYDAAGRATTSELHAGVAKVTVQNGGIVGGGTESNEGEAELLRIVTNPLGKVSNYYFKNFNGLWKRTRVEGQATQTCLASDSLREYDEGGNLVSATDWNGNTVEYTNDAKGREITRVEGKGTPEQRTVSTSWYGDSGLIHKVSDGIAETEYTYIENTNNIDTVITRDATSGENGRVWDFDYNELGKVASVDGPRNDIEDVTFFKYDISGNLIKSINPLGHEIRYRGFNSLGLPTEIIDTNNTLTNLEYNWRGQAVKTSIQIGLEQKVTSYSYDNIGNLVRIDLPSGGYVSYEYDLAKRLVAISADNGDRKDYILDLAGNVLRETTSNSQGSAVETYAREYDELSRLIKVVSTANYSRSFSYDANSNVVSASDTNSFSATSTFDALDRLVTQTDRELGVTRYAYDSQDNLISVTDQNNTDTTFDYNFAGQKTIQISPDTGTTQYSYDSAGNRTQKIDARGVVTNYVYDALNRLVEVNYPQAPEENLMFGYDQTSSCNYGVGKLTSVTDLSGTTRYQYGANGLPTGKFYGVNSSNYQIRYEYDVSGSLSALVYPNGRRVRFGLDRQGRVSGIFTQKSISEPEETLVSAVLYHPFGGVSSFVQGNGLVTSFLKDLDGRLIEQSVVGLDTIFRREYSYEGLLNLVQILDITDTSNSQLFEYDSLQRLIRADGAYGTLNYTYDPVGNRVSRMTLFDAITKEETYSYALGTSRLLAVALDEGGELFSRQLSYDLVGNLVRDERYDGANYNLEYGDASRLLFVKKEQQDIASYTSNALGQRVSKLSTDPLANEHYHYDELGKLISVSRIGENRINNYVFLEGQLVSVIVDDVATYPIEGCNGDVDSDGLKDWWEWLHFNSLGQGPDDDSDGDGESNAEEQLALSNPTKYGPELSVDGHNNNNGYIPIILASNSQYFEAAISLTDMDPGDEHSYRLVGAPDWLYFDEVTGKLWGYPTGAAEGVFENIFLEVVDSFDQLGVVVFNLDVAKNNAFFEMTSIIRNPRDVAGSEFGRKIEFVKDLNGDGLVDLAVGSPKSSRGSSLAKEGELFLYLNNGIGIDSIHSQRLSGNAKNARLGYDFTFIDTNNDDVSELFNCAYMYDFDSMDRPSGTCWYHNNTEGFINTSRESTFTGSQSSGNGSRLGSSVAKADFNGDGKVDLLVGEYAYDSNGVDTGGMQLYYGNSIPKSDRKGKINGLASSDRLGLGRVVSGDFNGDGFEDFAVSDYLHDFQMADSGVVRILLGSSHNIPWNAEYDFDGYLTGEPQSGAKFGEALASGDVNGDGYDDLVVSSVLRDESVADQGAVYVYLGSFGGFSPTYDMKFSPSNIYGEFGRSLAVSDVTGDGLEDILVGQPSFGENQTGRVFIFEGTTGALSSTPMSYLSPSKSGSGFGAYIAVGDYNADGGADIAISDYLYEDAEVGMDAGAVFLYKGLNIAAPAPEPQEIDNVDESTAKVGSWSTLTISVEVVGQNAFYHSSGQGDNSFTWNFSNAEGYYEVYANWIDHSNRASDAPYNIVTTSGVETVRVNQRSNGGVYPLLGAFELPANAEVTLTDDANGYVIADAVKILPIEFLPQEPIVIDNDDSRVSATGTWTTLAANVEVVGADSKYHAAGSGESSFSWNFDNSSGIYRVYANWIDHSNRASNAPYRITTKTGSETVRVDQRTGGGTYHLLGTYELNDSAVVTLSNDANGYVIADAIKLVFVGAPTEPTAPDIPDQPPEQVLERDNSDDAGVSERGTWTAYGSGSGFVGQDFLHTDGGSGESSFDWQMGNNVGRYNVYANWLSKSNRASNAPYTIATQTGSQSIFVDQRFGGGSYRLIGTFDLVANAVISLSNDADGKVIADAIKLEQVGQ